MNKPLLFIILSLCLASSFQANYDQATANELARASFATYCKKSLVNMKCGNNCNGLAGYKYVNQGEYIIGATADESLSFTTFVNVERKRFILAFRGTIGEVQLLNEIGYSAKTPFNLCKNIKNAQVMSYFYNGFLNRMRTNLVNHMKEMAEKYPDFEFYITGHSLGGALANLAALDLSCNGVLKKAQIHLWTYGSPRVGDFNFASAVVNAVGEVWRITHNRDIVPHIPMCKMNLFGDCTHENDDFLDSFLGSVNYAWHIWPEVHYSADYKTFKICTKQEDSACARQYKLYDANTDDHLNYLGATQGCS